MKTDTDMTVTERLLKMRDWTEKSNYHWGVADGMRRARQMAQDMELHEMALELTLLVYRAAEKGNSWAAQARGLMAKVA